MTIFNRCLLMILVFLKVFALEDRMEKKANGVLQGKVAVVTGAAQGIGEEIAVQFAQNGAYVILADINAEKGRHLEEKIIHQGGNAVFFKCDVASEVEMKHLFNFILNTYHKIDICINNAGIAIYKKIEDYSVEEWDRILDVNLKAIFLAAKYCFPAMKENHSGCFISVASVHARTTAPMNSPYVASKGAIVALTRALSLEGAPYNIRVNCISPGAIETPMLMENWGNIPPEKHPLVPRIPLNRLGKPAEIAHIALFLASDQASYLTGTEILADGGLSAHFK